MTANYLSAVYDLTAFGIFNIKNAIVGADMDNGITIEVSFDGGKSFVTVPKLNEKMVVSKSNGKIQVRITFEDTRKSTIYKVKTTGFFQNLEAGTSVNFTKLTTSKTYYTTIGRDGYYSISLPRGTYEVWYPVDGVKETIMSNFNPEVTYTPTHRLDKEAIIENAFKDIDWAKYTVFDTFADRSKMIFGSTIIDPEGDLSDGTTSRKCRYWTIGFE